MKRIFRQLSLVTSLVGLLAASAGTTVFAAGAPVLTATPSTQQVAKDSDVRITLAIDGGGAALNTVNVVATYPSDKLTFAGLDKNGSYFDAFIPASPQGHNGKLTFAASALENGSTSSSANLVTLLFAAKTDTGTAQIAFDDTQAANGGGEMGVDTSPVVLSFGSANDQSGNAIGISGARATDITATGASVVWHTSVPTTGTVDYGSTTNYGLSVSDSTLGTDHKVSLGNLFSGASLVHFRVTATDEESHSATSANHAFITAGYPVQITVIDHKGHPVSGTEVSISGARMDITTDHGIASLTNVAPGTRKVTLGDGSSQLIVVKALTGGAARTAQEFTITQSKSMVWPVVLTLALIAAIVTGVVLGKRNITATPSTPTSPAVPAPATSATKHKKATKAKS